VDCLSFTSRRRTIDLTVAVRSVDQQPQLHGAAGGLMIGVGSAGSAAFLEREAEHPRKAGIRFGIGASSTGRWPANRRWSGREACLRCRCARHPGGSRHCRGSPHHPRRRRPRRRTAHQGQPRRRGGGAPLHRRRGPLGLVDVTGAPPSRRRDHVRRKIAPALADRSSEKSRGPKPACPGMAISDPPSSRPVGRLRTV